MSTDDDSVFAQLAALEEEERTILKQTKVADKKTRQFEDKMRETDVRMIKAEERLRKASIEAAAYVPSTTSANPAAESELKAVRERLTRAQEKATKAEELLQETETKLRSTEEAVAAAKQQHSQSVTRGQNFGGEIATTKQKVNAALDDALLSEVRRTELKQKIEAWESSHEHLKLENTVAAYEAKLHHTQRELALAEADAMLAEERAAAHERAAEIASKQSPEIAEIALRRALDELTTKKSDLEKQRKEEEARAAAEAAERARKAEEDKRREAEELARREAEAKARKELEEKLRREEQERLEREAAELRARREAEEKARREAEERSRREAEEAQKAKDEQLARELAERRSTADREPTAAPSTPTLRKELDGSRRSLMGTPPASVSPRPEEGSAAAASPAAEEFSTRSRSSTGSRIRRTGPLQVGSITFTDIDKVKDEIANSLRPEISFSWFVVSYSAPTAITFTAAGQSSLTELAENLRDDQVQYAILRLSTPNATTKVRDILILWFGPSVKLMEKTKKRSHVGDIKRILQPVHCELTVLSKKNFNEKAILERTAIGAFPELE